MRLYVSLCFSSYPLNYAVYRVTTLLFLSMLLYAFMRRESTEDGKNDGNGN
nr:MAG TPA: hypothetical protein [Caudoviricetes sp.]